MPMIPDWDTNQVFVSDRLEEVEPALFAGLRGVFEGMPFDVLSGVREIWCRDFMPVQVGENTFCQFRYRPEYISVRRLEGLITPPEKCRLPFMTDYHREPIFLEGGNVVAARNRVVLTDKVFACNPGIEPARLQERLERVFGAECLFVPTEPNDEAGHADGVVRFVSESCVLINDSSAYSDYGTRLQHLLERKGLQVETLPMFLDEWDWLSPGLPSAVGNYLNYLRVGDIVVLPAYDRPEDRFAKEKVQQLMPGAKIFQLPCTSLAKRGGVLNCISWTIEKG
jgi:agmatine deiminase